MNLENILLLIINAFLPLLIGVVLTFLKKTNLFTNKKVYLTSQIIAGVVFGFIAVFSNEILVVSRGEYVHMSNIAPIVAGFLFGWPAGVISGGIGFVFKVLAGYTWNASVNFEVWPAAISILISGSLAGVLFDFLFEKKTPYWFYSIAYVMFTVFAYFGLVALFHIGDKEFIKNIITSTGLAMGLSNCISILLLCIFSNYYNKNFVQK